jgi:hypothetical protein
MTDKMKLWHEVAASVNPLKIRGTLWSATMHGKCSAIVLLLMIALFTARLALAADSQTEADEIPPLRPPIKEVQPGTWERYGTWIILGAAMALGAIAGTARWALRPRAFTPVAPEIQVRRRLEPLKGNRDAEMLPLISRGLRTYLVEVFRLPPEELTTAEFIEALNARAEVGSQLNQLHSGRDPFHRVPVNPPPNDDGAPAERVLTMGPEVIAATSDFLRRCDRVKFAPAADQGLWDPAAEALRIVDMAEARLPKPAPEAEKA